MKIKEIKRIRKIRFINKFSRKVDALNRLLRHIIVDCYCELLVNVKNRFLRFQFSHTCVTRALNRFHSSEKIYSS